MDWITTANGLIALLSGLVGLVIAAISAIAAIKSIIKANKDKSFNEKWALIMGMADAAMKEVEKSELKGLEKKEQVINAIKVSCKSAGLEIDEFIDQLGLYIDQTINFVNSMKK